MYEVKTVVVLDGYRLDLTFSDGTKGIVDLSGLVGKGVFSLWQDYEAFRQVEVGSSGELVWGDEIDLCPGSLYLQATGQEPQDIFPRLKREPTRA